MPKFQLFLEVSALGQSIETEYEIPSSEWEKMTSEEREQALKESGIDIFGINLAWKEVGETNHIELSQKSEGRFSK